MKLTTFALWDLLLLLFAKHTLHFAVYNIQFIIYYINLRSVLGHVIACVRAHVIRSCVPDFRNNPKVKNS